MQAKEPQQPARTLTSLHGLSGVADVHNSGLSGWRTNRSWVILILELISVPVVIFVLGKIL